MMIPSGKWDRLSMDFAGLLGTGEYLVVLVDDHSRYPEVEVISSMPDKAIIHRLTKIIADHGVPGEIRTDDAPPFNGQVFTKYAISVSFHHSKITPLWPEANGENHHKINIYCHSRGNH